MEDLRFSCKPPLTLLKANLKGLSQSDLLSSKKPVPPGPAGGSVSQETAGCRYRRVPPSRDRASMAYGVVGIQDLRIGSVGHTADW